VKNAISSTRRDRKLLEFSGNTAQNAYNDAIALLGFLTTNGQGAEGGGRITNQERGGV